MRNLLSLYLDTSPGTPAELDRLIQDMESTVADQFTEHEVEVLKDANPTFSRNPHFVTLPILEHATGYTKEEISRYRSGSSDGVPKQLIRLTRILNQRLQQDPSLAREAVMDWLDRKQTIDLGAV